MLLTEDDEFGLSLPSVLGTAPNSRKDEIKSDSGYQRRKISGQFGIQACPCNRMVVCSELRTLRAGLASKKTELTIRLTSRAQCVRVAEDAGAGS